MSEDYFLINLSAVIVPAFILLFGSVVISYLLLKRYSLAIKRLYQMNFNGVEMERKRIANDLHDQIGFTLTQVRNTLKEASRLQTDKNATAELQSAQFLISELHLSLRRLVENVYPRELMLDNWKDSFTSLAQAMSIGHCHIEVDIEVESEISQKQLHQMFRLSQELLANIINHNHSKWISLQIYEEQNKICLNFSYRYKKILHSLRQGNYPRGRGSFIIHERLRLLNAQLKKHKKDGYQYELITFNKNDENTTAG